MYKFFGGTTTMYKNSNNFIRVTLDHDDTFILDDPDTGITTKISSAVLHNKLFITETRIEDFFLQHFPYKTVCQIDERAQKRMRVIADWNYSYD